MKLVEYLAVGEGLRLYLPASGQTLHDKITSLTGSNEPIWLTYRFHDFMGIGSIVHGLTVGYR